MSLLFTLIHIYLSSLSHFRLLGIACQFGLDNVECMLNFVVFFGLCYTLLLLILLLFLWFGLEVNKTLFLIYSESPV